MQPLEGKQVLDVGCGTGDDSREPARLVGLKGRVVVVDYSAAMVAEVRRRTRDPGLPLEFREGDAMKLEFIDGSLQILFIKR